MADFWSPLLNTLLSEKDIGDGRINIGDRVSFNRNVHNHCVLQQAVRELVPNLSLFLLETCYRGVGALIQIRLQPAVSPQAQVDINQESMPFRHLITKVVKRRELNSKVFRVKRMHVTVLCHLSGGCPNYHCKRVVVFGRVNPPGEPDYRSGSVDLTNYLANRPEAEEIRPQVSLSIWYRVEFGKLKLALLRGLVSQLE